MEQMVENLPDNVPDEDGRVAGLTFDEALKAISAILSLERDTLDDFPSEVRLLISRAAPSLENPHEGISLKRAGQSVVDVVKAVLRQDNSSAGSLPKEYAILL